MGCDGWQWIVMSGERAFVGAGSRSEVIANRSWVKVLVVAVVVVAVVVIVVIAIAIESEW